MPKLKVPSKNKLPDEIFVVAKEIQDHYYNKELADWVVEDSYFFAFIHPHEPNLKSDAKRKDTQLGWAYNMDYTVRNNYKLGYIVYNGEWKYNEEIGKREFIVEVAKFQPIVLKNEAIDGFEIYECNTRYSTNNKVYRVKDPRGFVTEISAQSLLGIILDGEIKEGKILNKCKWQSNKNLVVFKGE